MKRIATILCGLWAAIACSIGDARAEKRVALVIGNGAYQSATRLANPVNDANAIADMFRRSGFEVVEARTDLGNLEFKRVAREFTAVARDADIAVMYFAGHGIEVNGTNYLIPIDAKLATDFDVEDEALSLDRMVRALEPAKRLRLVILDACRDNPFVRTMQRSVATRAVASGLAKVEPTQSDTLIAFAAKAGSTADDGRGTNSPFTTALLNHLAVPGRDVRIALGFVRDEVVKTTGNKQEPFVYGSLGGATVALVPEAKPAEAARPGTPAPVAAPSGIDPRRDYEFAERVGTREAWDSFLSVHRSGFYADLARAQRDKIALGSEPARVPSSAPSVPAVPAVPSVKQNIAVLPAPGGTPKAPAETQPAPETPKIAVLPSDPGRAIEVQPKPDAAEALALARDLQTELKRVGCDPGAVDGKWSPKSSAALAQFNRRAGEKHDIKVASIGALDAVKAQRGRICPLVCGRGEKVEGETCVAIPAPPPAAKKQAARPPEPSPRERARAREQARERVSTRPAPRASCPAGSSPFPQGGRMCCEMTPERGAARVFCP